ncbi:MAG: hypothetical protein ABW172_00500 [Candidatus Binatia bacterium]
MRRAALLCMATTLVLATVNVSGVVSAQYSGRYERYDRFSNIRDQRRDLEGIWYLGGHRDMRAEIVSSRRGLEATNEHGHTTRLEIGRSGIVQALDWEGGLRGTVRQDRIDWENGTTWLRQPVSRSSRPR